MKQYINKTCQIKVESNNTVLSFTGKILEITEEHITFLDKYSKPFTFRIKNIVEIRGNTNDF